MKNLIMASGALMLAVTGCQSTGEGALTGAMLGAAGGAIAGEIFAGSPGKGAAYGALVGAALGAYEGCSRAGTCWGRARDNGYRRYDGSGPFAVSSCKLARFGTPQRFCVLSSHAPCKARRRTGSKNP